MRIAKALLVAKALKHPVRNVDHSMLIALLKRPVQIPHKEFHILIIAAVVYDLAPGAIVVSLTRRAVRQAPNTVR